MSVADAYTELQRLDLNRGGDARVHSVRLLSTHDQPRFATRLAASGASGGSARLALGYALLATLPGIPMLLYGEEHGLSSVYGDHDPEDVWPDRMSMPWGAARRDPSLRAVVRSLFQARRESEALREGGLQLLFSDATTLVYRRQVDVEIVDVALNFASEPRTIGIEDAEYPRLLSFASVGGATVNGGAVEMPPHSAILARRERALGRSIAPALARRNAVLRDRDLSLAAPVATARPSRFFFSVTERCNLRCQHCSTLAPEKTKSGEARTMTKAVLDALAPELGLADYFAFVHGGEPVTAPILYDLLGAIAGARGGESYVAHLLTNGVMLDRAAAERLVRLGVSSIAFSLDGATADTNDSIRLGGRFYDVRENLQRLLRWRVEEGIELRVGISTVVLSQNLHELDRIVELGTDLGVDWIKLEAAVPATPFAKRSLVSYGAADVRAAIDAALKRGHESGVVMVDHTVERAIWRCRLDDETRRLLAADEMASRSVLHPCRTPWETACVEPNGDIRACDFSAPILGNVTEVPLRELWNVEAAQQLRRDASLTRLCGPTGPVVCLPRRE
jgi:MoaA/NifB/PqqE/SkfB family radical SAM enzyme